MRKFIFVLIVSFMILLPLQSIGFGYHVFEIRTDPQFSFNGVWQFPLSVVYQFNFPVPDFISGSATSLAFRLDNGLDFRTLKQDPETGEILQKVDPRYPERDYMTLFDEFNLVFSQGFLHLDFSDEDLLTFSVLVGGRFENAYEMLGYYSDSSHTEGLFHTTGKNDEGESVILDRTPFGSSFLKGTPELSGERSVFEISLSAGLDINFMKDDNTSLNGVRLSSWIRYSPTWLNWFTDTSDFFLSWNRLDLAWTLFRLPFIDDLSSLSMVLTNSTMYRYLTGEKVPYYIQGGEIWEAEALSTEQVITNSLALTLYGPQLFATDVYPFISAFFDLAYSWGRVLNTDSSRIDGDFAASCGARAELVLFNVARVYYEIGVVALSRNVEDMDLVQRFGFSVGI